MYWYCGAGWNSGECSACRQTEKRAKGRNSCQSITTRFRNPVDRCAVSRRLRGGLHPLEAPSHLRDLIDERQGSGADANISNISPWTGVVQRGEATCPVERTGC